MHQNHLMAGQKRQNLKNSVLAEENPMAKKEANFDLYIHELLITYFAREEHLQRGRSDRSNNL
jgi:hypothetical protein